MLKGDTSDETSLETYLFSSAIPCDRPGLREDSLLLTLVIAASKRLDTKGCVGTDVDRIGNVGSPEWNR